MWREQYSDIELITLFETRSGTDRSNALLALGQRAARELLLRAVNDSDWEVRKAGLSIWGKNMSPEQLLHALDDEFEAVRGFESCSDFHVEICS